MARAPAIDDRQSMPRRRAGRSHRRRLTLQRLPVLARHDDLELAFGTFPLIELALRARAAGVTRVLLDQSAQQVALAEISDVHQLHQRLVALLLQIAELIEDEGEPAAHARAE